MNAEQFLQTHFGQLLGKVFSPYDNLSEQVFYSVALEQGERFAAENERVLALLAPSFYVVECPIGTNPADVLPKVMPQATAIASASLLSVHYIRRYAEQRFLIGCYKNEAHLQWILGKNDKGTMLYNVRLQTKGLSRNGTFPRSWLEKGDVRFVILYNEETLLQNEYRVFHVHHHAVLSEERMRQALYPNPQGNCFCFVFDEEVQLSPRIDIAKIISFARLSRNNKYIDGTPIILTGSEMLSDGY